MLGGIGNSVAFKQLGRRELKPGIAQRSRLHLHQAKVSSSGGRTVRSRKAKDVA